ncbi:MAG: hypothetical protein OER21_07890 [Gemmatimonadota bacterium]|nr:hypothetical protein [Gemmatimonadota bacterium]
MRCRLSYLLVTTALVAMPTSLCAQGLSVVINQLFTFGDCGEPLCLDLGPSSIHGNHFIPAVTQGNETVIGFLTQSIGKSTANLPISATSSGTTFRIVGGLPVRTSTSAGPIYAERSQTLGQGRFFVGANVSGVSFSSLNGAPLSDLGFTFSHEDVGNPGLGDPVLENDFITTRVALDVNVQVAALFATVGVTDFIDLGVAVPFVRTAVSGTSDAQINPFGPVAVHNFNGDTLNPVLRATSAAAGSAAGLGDVVGRVKINLGQGAKAGVALLSDVRLPTGKEEDLLGAGSASIRGLAIIALQFGTVSPHVNVGYAARTDTLQTDAVLGTLGFDALLADWFTFAFDMVSEWQVGGNPLQLPGPIVFTQPFDRQLPSTTIPTKREDILNASLGAKFTVRGGMVLVVNGLIPLLRTGMQPDYVWTAGLEYAF